MAIERRNKLIFIGLLIASAILYNWQSTSFEGPYSTHQWRQTDCLSITSNYYEDDLPFLEPQINWIDFNGNSKTVSEFPIIYYTVAQIWKLTGKNYVVYRFIVLTIVLLGIYYLFKLSSDLLKDDFWAGFIALLFFSSPLLAYYGNNFLADAPALGIALIASYHLYMFYRYGMTNRLYLAVIFFLLAGLLKITALFVFVATLPAFLVIGVKAIRERKFTLHYVIPLVILVAGIMSWYAYARMYNEANVKGIFLQAFLPIWELNSDHIAAIRTQFLENNLKIYFDRTLFVLLLLLVVYLLVRIRKVNAFLMSVLVTTIIGVILYILLFYRVFDVHDYYLINLLVFIPIILLTFFDYLKRNNISILDNKWFRIAAVLLVIAMIYRGAGFVRMRYDQHDFIVQHSIVPTEDLKWYHEGYEKGFRSLEDIEPYLDSIGITRSDTIISLPDFSINISLYLMNRKGFTQYGYAPESEVEMINYYKGLGAKYLIVNQKDYLSSPHLTPFIKNKIGEHGTVTIYTL